MAFTSPSYWTLKRKAKALVDEKLQLAHSQGLHCWDSQTETPTEEFEDCQSPDDEFFDALEFTETESSSDSDRDFPESLQSRLASWAVLHNITHSALNGLLRILSDHHPNLPLDARTLLGTVRCSQISCKDIDGGQYYHFGVLASIRHILQKHKDLLKETPLLDLQINIDGLPLFKSSTTQFWPILGIIENLPGHEPFIIGLFCGNQKPRSLDAFLHDFVSEVIDLEMTRGRTRLPTGQLIPSQCTPTERILLQMLGELQSQVQHLTEIVTQRPPFLGNSPAETPLTMCAEDGGLPLQDTEELKNIEMQLGNVEFKNKLVSKLSVAGGQTLKKTVWRICGKVFAPQLAVNLNWCGRGDKTAMRNTNIVGVIIQSALRNPLLSAPNEAEAEKTIKEWLRLSRDRLTRRMR